MARSHSSSRLVTIGLESHISWHDQRKREAEMWSAGASKSLLDVVGTAAEEEPLPKMSYFILFRYSTVWERVMVVLGIICASVGSLGVPFANVLYGEFTSLLIDRSVGVGSSSPTFLLQMFGGGRKLTDASKEENTAAIREDSMAYGVGSFAGALAELIFTAIAIDILNRVGLKQIGRIRKRFFESILRQDMSWYDTASSSTNFASKITEDLDKMKEGIGEKVAIFTFLVMTFVTGIVASFFYGWELTLVVLICCPFIILSTALVAKIQSSLTVRELQAYSGAGTVAEEVFGGIRTVFAFSGERKERQRFAKRLVPAEQTGRKKGLYSGLGAGVMWFIIYFCYAIAIWYGVRLILAERGEEIRRYTPAVLVIVLFGIIMGAQNLGFSTPHIEAFGTAKGAAQKVFSIIDRESSIDSMDDKGLKPEAVLGDIDFEDLRFHYPARPDIPVLKGFSLNVKAGQTVSLVGASGCGKSTCLQLMQRFYDPLSGTVRLDGRDISDLNIGWLRAQIGVVGQEPVLFATTIAENIRYGKPSATKQEIEAAARLANCHDFIVKLPLGYKTLVGERGAQLSGGQKQRIAIARAMVRDPKILLLDEATSALDPTSERRVQEALEVASKGRTTLVVSHRLSTVTNSDKIVFVKNGIVVEEGTHAELMAKGGHYYQMVGISKRRGTNADEVDERNANDMIQRKKAEIYDRKADFEEKEEEEEEDDDDHAKTEGTTETKTHKTKEKKKNKHKITMRQVVKLNAPEWKYILCGCIAAMLLGATFPAWAVFFGHFFGVLSYGDDDYVRSEADFLSYMFISIGLVAGLGTLVQIYMFNMAGVKMTSRLRQRTFNAILSQDVTFFDDKHNSTGALCARLASDCSNIQGATGARIGIMVQAGSTLLVGIVIAFTFSWHLTLVTLVTIPFVCLSIFLEAKLMESSTIAEKAAIESASQVAVEAISNIRTVISLGQEQGVLERYYAQIDQADNACRQKLRFRGLVFGLSQAAPFFAYGISLYYGGILVTRGQMAYENIIKVSEALIFGSWMLGQALAYAPNATAAILSARRLLKLFEETSAVKLSVRLSDDKYPNEERHDDDITYEDVHFHYPNRQNLPILQDFNLTIKSGTTVALVGPSGSGKSTCVQLLLRYYDPVRGYVKVGGTPTTQFTFEELRSQMGLVSQEPVLFDRTIAENIAYGDNFRKNIPMFEIIEAAKKSNIHDFIMTLPNGYRTSLGSKGAHLSGGQKQRIAIARALLRNPQILILDEATSALDMESEEVVQKALDVARRGRTCVTIAHRLTTVRDADQICVLKKGVVVEKGTHAQLMSKDGVYAELYWMQQVA